MKYTALEKLAHHLCNTLAEHQAEGITWRNLSGESRIYWLNKAHDQLITKAKAQALEEAADALGADSEEFGKTALTLTGEDNTRYHAYSAALSSAAYRIRKSARQLTEES